MIKLFLLNWKKKKEIIRIWNPFTFAYFIAYCFYLKKKKKKIPTCCGKVHARLDFGKMFMQKFIPLFIDFPTLVSGHLDFYVKILKGGLI